MMKKSMIAAAGCVLVLFASRQAQALWTVADVTPAAPIASDRTFSVTSESAESLRKVRVTVKPLGKKPLSPLLSGYVWLHDGQRFLGEIAVEEQRAGESSVFSMTLDPDVARNSRFEVHEPTYIWKKGQTTRPDRNAPHSELPLGGQMFRLDLGKFLAAEKP
jgi:hypothetical protein